MKILSFDPGKANFAYAVINSKGRCKEHGFLRTITSLSFEKIVDEVSGFSVDLERLIKNTSPDFIAIERMQHRPKFGGGAVVEYINIMIGIILATARVNGIRVHAVSSGIWKKHMKEVFKIPGKDKSFTMATQKLTVPAPKGMKRKFRGKMVAVKKTSKLVTGCLAGQAGHDCVKGGGVISPHEADAIGIGCYCWYRMTGLDIVRKVLT